METWATILIFVLALVLHPECQAKAQEEMDRVLGGVRLPQFEDRASLPYMEWLLQETYRWHNAAPMGECLDIFQGLLSFLSSGVPHRSTEDDIYEGMFIPKGSVVIANARLVLLIILASFPNHYSKRYIVGRGGIQRSSHI